MMIDDKILKNIETKDIKEIDLDTVFLHYTDKNNLKGILEKGLEPRIGMNAIFVEKSKKVFFSMGDKGALVIMDVWLKWLIVKPKSNLIYWIGANLLKIPYFPKFMHKIISSSNKKNKRKHLWAYKKLNMILDNSVYLIMDLEENIDFSFDDVDEAKVIFKRAPKYIRSVYAHDSDFHNPIIEYWNMHTFSNKIIETSKPSLLKTKDSYSANDILIDMINSNIQYVKDYCPYLIEYLKYINTKEVSDE